VVFRRLGIKRHEALALDHLGAALACLGSYQDAVAVTRASLSFDRETGDRLRLGRKLSLLALYYDTLGERARATEFLEHSQHVLGAMVSMEATPGRKEAECAQVELHLRRAEPARAAALLGPLRAQIDRHGPFLAARERLLSARVLVALDDAAHAALSGDTHPRSLGSGDGSGDTHPSPRLREAEDAAETARVLCQEHDFLSLEVEALAMLAWLCARRGADAEARDAAETADTRLGAAVAVERPAAVRIQLAHAFAWLGSPVDATRLWESARELVLAQVETVRGEPARERFRATSDVAELLARPAPSEP
jgi:tetratricopeptide (TPR) repeat protein